jgi:class 3 adenylate cyclase
VQIMALRRALSETPGGGSWIETMPRRGYRFVGPVITAVEEDATLAPSGVDAAPDPMPTPHHEAERRQITAMSCELVGDSARADGSDLEDWREAVGAFQRCVSETVAHHDGFIAKSLGNTALILFGYPTAHEHDAEQAVRAGLDLCAAVRPLRSDAGAPVCCRVGIATGMVIVGDPVGAGAASESIVGDAPNLAARLALSARVDTVAIEPATRRLIGNLFDCRELGAIGTTGAGEPIRSWQVLAQSAVTSRFEALRGSALSTLIGRDEEVDLLLRRWARAKTGVGQVVLLSGEPGIGKSRIITEFEERIRAEAHLYLRYFCSPHHQDSRLFPFIDQLSRAAGFTLEDGPAAKMEKLGILLARATPPEEDVAFLAALMSLPASRRHQVPELSPQRKKEKTLQALIRQLEGLVRQQPVVVVFEDAHWIDPTSRELLDLTVERVPSLRALLVVTFRPEFQQPWAGQPQVTMLALNRLERRDRTVLVSEIAGGKALPNEVIVQIDGGGGGSIPEGAGPACAVTRRPQASAVGTRTIECIGRRAAFRQGFRCVRDRARLRPRTRVVGTAGFSLRVRWGSRRTVGVSYVPRRT